MSAVAAYGALGGSEAAPRRRGRFTSSLTVPELLEAVARVAQAAAKNGQDPANLTKRIWDTARVLSGEDLPQAETIRQRLRLSWEAVLTCALLPPEDRGIYLRNRDDPDWGINFGELTPEYLSRILQAAALRLPAGSFLSALAYDRIIEDLEAEARASRHAEPSRHPRSVGILARFGGDWEKALANAGLPVPPKQQPSPNRVEIPAMVEALEKVVIALGGKLPNRNYFQAWCAIKGIPLRSRPGWWATTVAELRKQRAAAGLTTPERVSPYRDLPALPARAEKNRSIKWNRESVIEALRLYAHYHQSGRWPSEHDYQTKAVGNPDLPSLAALQRHGPFSALCKEAGIL